MGASWSWGALAYSAKEPSVQPNTASPGQDVECEAANENYIDGQTVIGNVPGNQGTQHDATKPSKTGTQLESGAPQ